MKHKLVAVLAGIFLTAAAGASVVLAQKSDATAQKHVIVASGPEHVEKRVIRIGGGEGTWLGVAVADVTSEKAKELMLAGEYGALVEDVRDDSPAAKAGLKKDDVILRFAGEKVRSVAELRRLVRETPAGRTVSIEISRDGHTQTLSAEIAKAPERKWFSQFDMPDVNDSHVRIFKMPEVHVPDFDFNMMFVGTPRLGISAEELTSQLAGYFGVWQGKGVLVREVKDGTPAQKAGLKAGDVITKVNGTTIASVADLREKLRSESKEKYKVTLTIVRDRKEQTVNVQLEPEKQFLGPQETAKLQKEILNPDYLRMLKDQIKAQTESWKNNPDIKRLESGQIKEEIERSMKKYRKDMEQYEKDLKKLTLERLEQPI